MTQVTEKEYETVEKEVQRYKCDHCGVVVDEEEMNEVVIHDGVTDYKKGLSEDNLSEKHLCDSCINVREALQIREERASVRERWEWFAEKITAPYLWGVGGYTIGAGAVWFAGEMLVSSDGTVGMVMMELFAATVLAVLGLLIWTFVMGMVIDNAL